MVFLSRDLAVQVLLSVVELSTVGQDRMNPMWYCAIWTLLRRVEEVEKQVHGGVDGRKRIGCVRRRIGSVLGRAAGRRLSSSFAVDLCIVVVIW